MQLTLVEIAIYAYTLFIIVLLISEERDPSTTLAWIMLLVLLPGVGLVAYFLFGRDWRKRRSPRSRFAIDEGHRTVRPLYERYATAAEDALAAGPLVSRVSRAIQTQNGTRPLPCTDLEIMPAGERLFEQLFADIEAAERFVHLEYFIWEQDELTARLCDLLAAKVASGVEVRVLYDWVGSIGYGKRQLKALAAAGASVKADAARIAKLNYRNHRKMAVIDGLIAYTGGHNVGQEYIDGGPRFDTWRDTSIRFRGPLVADLHRLFAERWYEGCGENLFDAAHFPEQPDVAADAAIWSQLVFSGPETKWEAIRQAYVLAIASASERVWIQSPYFVPDTSVMEVLSAQSLASVDVRFMMTGVPDKRIPWNAAKSYLYRFAHSGGRAYHYEAGFFHAKTMSIDGVIGVVGTANFDIRSFLLHDELSLFFYDEKVAAQLDAIFAGDIDRSRSVTADLLSDEPWRDRFRYALARLASRLM